MADVRSLLRSELASRGSSSQTGSGAGARVTKKRKIEGADHTIHALHKKSRPTTPAHIAASDIGDSNEGAVSKLVTDVEDIIEEEEDAASQGDENAGNNDTVSSSEQQNLLAANTAQLSTSQQAAVDEDEWAAFEREVVAPTRVQQPQVPSAAVAGATISAAALTTEELAAQQQRQKEEQARAREADVEGEKEDAARFLEEEFEEMEQLEERVKRLKAMREELRTQPSLESNGATIEDKTQQGENDDAGSEDDEDDAEWDDWRFR